MKYDKDLAVFAKRTDWYILVHGISYVPTEIAPEYAKKAMANYNKNHIENEKKQNQKDN